MMLSPHRSYETESMKSHKTKTMTLRNNTKIQEKYVSTKASILRRGKIWMVHRKIG